MIVLLSSIVDHGHDIRVVVLKQVKTQVNRGKKVQYGENKERKIQKYLGKRGYRQTVCLVKKKILLFIRSLSEVKF